MSPEDGNGKDTGQVWQVAPALFLELDGPVRHSRAGAQSIRDENDVAVYPDVEPALWQWRSQGYLVFGVSNQGGVGAGLKTAPEVKAITEAMLARFERNPFHAINECYHHPEGCVPPFHLRSLLRKPDYGMLVLHEVSAFANHFILDYSRSLMIGDRPEDVECARRAGIAFMLSSAFFQRAAGAL